jgi:hypothetical protein
MQLAALRGTIADQPVIQTCLETTHAHFTLACFTGDHPEIGPLFEAFSIVAWGKQAVRLRRAAPGDSVLVLGVLRQGYVTRGEVNCSDIEIRAWKVLRLHRRR